MKRVREFLSDCGAAVIIGLALILLSGCASTSQIEYRYAELPPIPVVARPALATDDLKPGDAPATVIQAHRETILSLMSWGKQLEAILDGLRKKPTSAP